MRDIINDWLTKDCASTKKVEVTNLLISLNIMSGIKTSELKGCIHPECAYC